MTQTSRSPFSGAHAFRARDKTLRCVGLVSLLHWSVFVGTAHSQTVAPAWSAEGDQPNAHFGYSVASAGDVNGDGYSDVLVGAPENDNGQADEGTAYLFLGSPAGLALTPAWTAESNQPGAHLGTSVASAGDVNNDGYRDVLVGVPDYDDGQEDEGAVFLYLGSPGGLSSNPAKLWQQNHAGGGFGSSVGCAGDVNADGFDDVLVGAPGFDGGESDEGAAYLFLGAASDLQSAPVWFAEGNQAGASFGASVAALGDMNGDGFDDVVIGAPLFDGGHIDEGQARAFGGTSSGLSASPLQNFERDEEGAHFGFSVAGAGDLSGNGIRRILFGAPIYAYTHTEEGGTWFATLGQAPFFLDFGGQDFAHRGVSIASAGDVNADGMMDVVIGADGFDAGEEDEGRVTVHLGHPSFVVDRTAAWVADGNQPFSAFGFSVASAGDVNGDGYDDVVVGAPKFDAGQSDEGSAFVFLGPSGIPVGVIEESETAELLTFRLAGPNPFRTGMSLSYTIPRHGQVHLSVFDVTGRQRALLVNEEQEAGSHSVTWNGRDEFGVECFSGVYFVRLALGSSVIVHKTVLIK